MRWFLSYSFSVILVVFMLIDVNAQYTDVINSNRPSQSMGAFSVGKNVYQLEQGISIRQGSFPALYDASYTGLGTKTELRIGVFREQLELIGAVDYQMDALSYSNTLGTFKIDRNAPRDLSAGIKYLVFDPFRRVDKYKVNVYSWHANRRLRWRDLVPAVSVYGGAQFSTTGVFPYQENFYQLYQFNYKPITEPTVSGQATLILQQHLRPGLVLVHNIGMRYISAEITQQKLIGTLTYSTRSNWSYFIEYRIDESPLYTDTTLASGLAYLVSSNLQLDAFLQRSLKETPQLMTAGIGVSFRIDRHNDFVGQPQSYDESRKSRQNRKAVNRQSKLNKKSEKRSNKGLRKLEKEQKRIERKLRKL